MHIPENADAKYRASLIALRYPSTEWRARVADIPTAQQKEALRFLAGLYGTREVAAEARRQREARGGTKR